MKTIETSILTNLYDFIFGKGYVYDYWRNEKTRMEYILERWKR